MLRNLGHVGRKVFCLYMSPEASWDLQLLVCGSGVNRTDPEKRAWSQLWSLNRTRGWALISRGTVACDLKMLSISPCEIPTQQTSCSPAQQEKDRATMFCNTQGPFPLHFFSEKKKCDEATYSLLQNELSSCHLPIDFNKVTCLQV